MHVVAAVIARPNIAVSIEYTGGCFSTTLPIVAIVLGPAAAREFLNLKQECFIMGLGTGERLSLNCYFGVVIMATRLQMNLNEITEGSMGRNQPFDGGAIGLSGCFHHGYFHLYDDYCCTGYFHDVGFLLSD